MAELISMLLAAEASASLVDAASCNSSRGLGTLASSTLPASGQSGKGSRTSVIECDGSERSQSFKHADETHESDA